MQTWIVDIENFNNLFFVGIKDFKNQTITNYEVSERRDDRQPLYEALAKFDGYLVTFNGLHYDEVVLKYFLKEYDKLKKLSVEKFLKEIKNISNHTIDSDKYPTSFDKIKWYKWYKGTNWTSIDLLCYWSKMLRLSKKISLKSLAVQLNHDEIQELPYLHDKLLTADEIEEVVRYNNRNDLGVTEKLFVKMKEDILLRNYIEKEYGLPCYSYDAPKIAGELLIKDYCEQTYNDQEHERLEEYIREFKKQRFDPYTGKIQDIMGNFKVDFKLPQFQKVYEEMMNSDRSVSFIIPFIHEPSDTRIKMSYGQGGKHSLQENEYYTSEDYQIVTSDFALTQWRK